MPLTLLSGTAAAEAVAAIVVYENHAVVTPILSRWQRHMIPAS